MSICQACGGVIGRECFNPQECAEIAGDMAERSREQPDPREADEYITKLEAERAALVEALRDVRECAKAINSGDFALTGVDVGHYVADIQRITEAALKLATH